MPFPMNDLILLAPEIIVASIASIIPVIWAFSSRDNRWLILLIALAGNITAAAVALSSVGIESTEIMGGQFTVDRFTTYLRLAILFVASASLIMMVDQLEKVPFGAIASILMFSTTGMLLLVGATDLILVFVAIELMSIPVYALTGMTRYRARSVEAAIKYFTMGAFGTAILAYGIAWTYGVTGSTSLKNISTVIAQSEINSAFLFAMGLLLAGIAFKIAIVPFHAWTPDAYDGAPTPVTAFMSVAPKIAAFAILIRLIGVAYAPLTDTVQVLLVTLATITMVVGNLLAVSQQNVKRLLAYSSIAHSGYMLAGISATTVVAGNMVYTGFHTLLYYAIAYALMNLGAFGIIFWVEQNQNTVHLNGFKGLARSAPVTALVMTLVLISLTGIPPTAGFFGKLFIIQTLISSQLGWLAIILVLMSVVSAYYYLRIVVNMFMHEPENIGSESKNQRAMPDSIGFVVLVSGVGTLALGIFANWLYQFAVDSIALAAL